jgi:deoxycytidylate deaminase
MYKKMNLEITFEEWLKTDDFKDSHREWSKLYEVHAEANALTGISKANAHNCVMYSLYAPCDACAKAIKSYGISTVYYKHKYKHGDAALQRLNLLGVNCVQV